MSQETPVANCIYCQTENSEPSAEHVIADALGGCLTLRPSDVCKTCNNALNEAVDRPVLRDLLPIVSQLEIPGKRGDVPTWTVVETIDGEERRFVVDQTSIRSRDKRKLLKREGGNYYFRADSIEELERARDEIAASRSSGKVELTITGEEAPNLPEGRVDFTDFTQPHWTRWAAKTALNLICYALGNAAAQSVEFDELRQHARFASQAPKDLRVGGIGAEIDEVENIPAVHRLLLEVSGGTLRLQVRLFEYLALAIEQTTNRQLEYQLSLTLDAREKRVTYDSRSV